MRPLIHEWGPSGDKLDREALLHNRGEDHSPRNTPITRSCGDEAVLEVSSSMSAAWDGSHVGGLRRPAALDHMFRGRWFDVLSH